MVKKTVHTLATWHSQLLHQIHSNVTLIITLMYNRLNREDRLEYNMKCTQDNTKKQCQNITMCNCSFCKKSNKTI